MTTAATSSILPRSMMNAKETASANGLPMTSSIRPTTTVATSALATTAAQTASDLKIMVSYNVSVKNSKIDQLVDWGQTAETIDGHKKPEIEQAITNKVLELEERAKTVTEWPSVRADLLKLTKISSEHYKQLKLRIFNLLIHCLEMDSANRDTYEGLMRIILVLHEDLAPSNAQQHSIMFQHKLARAISAAVILYLRHYKNTKVNGITKDDKDKLLKIQNEFNRLNTNSNRNCGVEYACQMALEASKRVTDSSTGFSQLLELLSTFVGSLGDAYKQDVAECIAGLKKIFDSLENKFTRQWFETIYLLRETVLRAPDDVKKRAAIQTFLAETRTKEDWKVIYGALDMLAEIVQKVSQPNELKIILFGKTIERKTTSATQLKTVKLPGIMDFCDFQENAAKALLKPSKDDLFADESICKKAQKISGRIIKKLETSDDGRKVLCAQFNRAAEITKKITIINRLGIVVPHNRKDQNSWIQSSPVSSTKRNSSPSISLSSSISSVASSRLQHSESDEKDRKESIQQTQLPNLFTRDNTDVVIASANPEIDPVLTGAVPRTGFGERTQPMNDPKDPFLKAVKSGSEEDVFRFLHMIPNVNLFARDERGWSCLHHAAYRRDLQILKTLLSKSEIVTLITSTTKLGLTPIMIAAAEGRYYDVTSTLLNHVINVSVEDDDGFNAMHYAAYHNNCEAIRQLGHKDNKLIHSPDRKKATPLMHAAAGGAADACEVLLRKGADPHIKGAKGWTALHAAAAKGSEDTVEAILNYKPNSVLQIKSLYGTMNPLSTYDDDRVANSGDIKEKHALHSSEEDEQEARINKLITATDDLGFNVMHAAVAFKHKALVINLKQYAQILNARAKDGRTPLMLAVGTSDRNTDDLFFDLHSANGIDVTITDANDWNVLHWAVSRRQLKIVQALANHQNLINARNAKGRTPLMLSLIGKKEDKIFEALVASPHVDVTIADNEGWTALHFAASQRRAIQVSSLLKKSSANVNALTRVGMTPMMLAKQNVPKHKLHSAIDLENNLLEGTIKELVAKGGDPNAGSCAGSCLSAICCFGSTPQS